MYRKLVITLSILLFGIIVSCDQSSPLGYSEPVPETDSTEPSAAPQFMRDSLNGQEYPASSEAYRYQGEEEMPSKTRSGFNPKNGYTVEIDSTGFSVEP